MHLIPEELLREVLKSEYEISPKILDVSGWGFRTVAYYIENEDGRKYIGKTAEFSEKKLYQAMKDVYFASLLHATIPTQAYLKNREGNYVTQFNGSMIRIANFIEGACPFDMNLDIISLMVNQLEKIHAFNLNDVVYELESVEGHRKVLLHGDLTPSNVVMNDKEISCVMDFEDMLIGPAEYDLAKTAVFGWFRMKDIPFYQVLDQVKRSYHGDTDTFLLKQYAADHARHYRDQVQDNKDDYEDLSNWNDDFSFASIAYETISQSLRG